MIYTNAAYEEGVAKSCKRVQARGMSLVQECAAHSQDSMTGYIFILIAGNSLKGLMDIDN